MFHVARRDALWYRRGGDHNGEDAEGREALMWAFEASLIAMTGKHFGIGGLPAPIIGVSLDKPGHSVSERALDALSHVTSDPSAPRGYFMGDRAYTPGAKAEKLQEPLRREGYRLIGDLYEAQKGQVTSEYEGAKQVDGGWYCPAMPQNLIEFTAGKDNKALLDDEQSQRLLADREKFRLRVKDVSEKGDVRYMCPARGPGATIACPLAEAHSKKSPVRRKTRSRMQPKASVAPVVPNSSGLLALTPEQVPQPRDCGKVCTNKNSLTIPVTVASKQAQQGPGWATTAWGKIYHKGRNIIESRNQLLKGAGGSAIGDRTSRMVRGFSKQWLVIAVAAVAVNIRLVDAYLRRTGKELTPVPPTPPEPTRKTGGDVTSEPGWANAPPVTA